VFSPFLIAKIFLIQIYCDLNLDRKINLVYINFKSWEIKMGGRYFKKLSISGLHE
jgi:hypothetical protein